MARRSDLGDLPPGLMDNLSLGAGTPTGKVCSIEILRGGGFFSQDLSPHFSQGKANSSAQAEASFSPPSDDSPLGEPSLSRAGPLGEVVMSRSCICSQLALFVSASSGPRTGSGM